MSTEPPATPPGDGLLIVDKPAGWTSHDVVGRTRRLCRTRRVGHAGTLDPMATGVLVLGVNRATRLLTFLVGCDKSYDATIRLGRSTLTDDAEGEVTATHDTTGTTDADIISATTRLTGDLQQVPSSVSAIKVAGERSYARVRAGQEVELPPRPVRVDRFDVHRIQRLAVDTSGDAGGHVIDLDVTVDVSSGTYVRALARDLGADLGVGGHLTALRRTRVGGFTLDRARTLAELQAEVDAAAADPSRGAAPVLIDLATAAGSTLPVRRLTAAEATAVGYGQRVASAEPGRTGPVAALGPDGNLVAVLDESGPQATSRAVFAAH